MYKLKLIFFSLIVSSHIIICAQEKEVFLCFDNFSSETYLKENGIGITISEKKYYKSLTNFFIQSELFENLKHPINDTLNSSELNKITFSNVDSLKLKVKKSNAYYPFKVFPNISLIEKISENKFIKHKVKWVYYIE